MLDKLNKLRVKHYNDDNQERHFDLKLITYQISLKGRIIGM